jgi:hypothetical protein
MLALASSTRIYLKSFLQNKGTIETNSFIFFPLLSQIMFIEQKVETSTFCLMRNPVKFALDSTVDEQTQSNRACNIFNFAVLGFL